MRCAQPSAVLRAWVAVLAGAIAMAAAPSATAASTRCARPGYLALRTTGLSVNAACVADRVSFRVRAHGQGFGWKRARREQGGSWAAYIGGRGDFDFVAGIVRYGFDVTVRACSDGTCRKQRWACPSGGRPCRHQ